MMKLASPTADTPSLTDLNAALQKLEPETPGLWGTMDASAMVEHCGRFIDLYAGRTAVALPVRMLARALGPMFLRRVIAKSPLETPRDLRTLGALRVVASERDSVEWRGRVERLAAGLSEMRELEAPYRNPLYGPMDPEAARTLVRHHTAHHFHQFGLL